MTALRNSLLLAGVALFGLAQLDAAGPPPARPAPPAGYRTVATALTTRAADIAPEAQAAQPGYLGAGVEAQNGKLVVTAVASDSPAEKAGLKEGDVILTAGGQPVAGAAALAEAVRARAPGEKLTLAVARGDTAHQLTATLAAPSRPLAPAGGAGRGGPRVILGVQVEPVDEGLKLTSVTAGRPAEKAGLKAGDVLTAIDGESLAGATAMRGVAERKAGDVIKLTVLRGGKSFEARATLIADPTAGPGRGGRGGQRPDWDTRGGLTVFRKPAYKLAVVAVEFPDVKHNDKITARHWEESLFSTGTYTSASATGQRVHGSMNDYYREQSCGALRVEGKVFDWVQVSKKREAYGQQGSNRNALLTEALDKLLARDGEAALDGYDGIFYLYAGARVQTQRGGLFWPHRSSVAHNGKRWAYFICPEGGRTMASISVITHEFGHMLGLPDLYARPEQPGSEGLGVWCTMSVGHGQNGKPLHISAYCKVRLGWLTPAVIDPRTKQKLVLSPVFGSTKECYKVLLRPDGSEYLLLENRTKRGFDRDLPAEGLLIWRVTDGRVVLEESHGIGGPAGPSQHLMSVPYPSRSNTAFTPLTTPSSKSLKGGGLPCWITNIKRLPDGRITFHVGYEYL